MRREDFTVETEDGEYPTLVVRFDGTARELQDRLDDDGDTRDVTDLDVAYRRTPGDDVDGVLGVTDRVTGEFIFEAVATIETIRAVVEGATPPADGDDPRYRLRVEYGQDDPLVADKHTLLVYDADGDLDRSHSLIPGSVEI